LVPSDSGPCAQPRRIGVSAETYNNLWSNPMPRKFKFWHERGHHSQPRRRVASRRRRINPLRAANLGLERLEDRHLLSAGTLDPTFNPTGTLPGTLVGDLFFLGAETIAVQPDGKILVGGTYQPPVGGVNAQDFAVARYLSNGQLDTTFGTTDSDGINGLATADFDDGGTFSGQDVAFDMKVDSLGRIVMVGRAFNGAGNQLMAIARFDANGSLDTSFSGDGKVTHATPGFIPELRGLELQSDGKIVVVGISRTGSSSTNNFFVGRLNSNGSLDTAGFGGGLGYVMTDFGSSRNDSAFDVAIQSDGKIVVAGQATIGTVTQFGLARYNVNGTLDTATDGFDTQEFGTGGKVTTPIVFGLTTDNIRALAIQADGKIIVTGNSSETNSTNLVMARYNTDGSLDTSFNSTGASLNAAATQPGVLLINIQPTNPSTDRTRDFGEGLVIQPDGNYVVVGASANVSGNFPNTVTSNGRLLAMRVLAATGTLDTSFGSGGITLIDMAPGASGESLNEVAIQPDGKIIAAGAFDDNNTINDGYSIARFESGLALAPSISGDADVDEGSLYTLNLSSSDPTTSQWTINWGDGVQIVSGNPSSVTHVYVDGDANYTISATIDTSTGTVAAGNTVDVTVHNVAPTLAISGAADVDEGSIYTLNLSSSDPGSDTITSWTINWGDGTQVVTGNPTSATHTYIDGDAPYIISATATDEDGTFSAGNTVAVTVHNVAPTADDATFNLVENSPNGTVVGTVTATDPGDDSPLFSIAGGSGAAAFSINSSTGEISVANSALLDFETSPVLTLNVEVDDGDGGFDTASVTINLVNQASIVGFVFVDVNQNGLYEANEPGIDGVEIQLLDEFGNPVLDSLGNAITAITSSGGFYLFEDLDPGTYQLFEVQPTGVDDGAEELGSLGGTIVGNDRMQLTLAETDAFDYAFAEIGQQLASGDAATIGFWQNKHGQALITQGGAQLAGWLTSNFSNVFGNTLVGASGSDVAKFYREQLFKQIGKKSAGPAKVDAQFMAVAFAAYFTSLNLAGQVAMMYGFNVTDTGIGTKIVNVGTNGAAFGVANGTDLTILQLLLATNDLTDQPDSELEFAAVYDTNGDGVISADEASLRTMANDIYSAINEAGGI
jgi:uncharacterized delta-60 repeat protein